MTGMDDALGQLERRVGEKWAAAAAARFPADVDPFDPSDWLGDEPHAEPVMQFPREQWVSYPNKRTAALIVADNMLNNADDLTDMQWTLLCRIMLYGGKTRIV